MVGNLLSSSRLKEKTFKGIVWMGGASILKILAQLIFMGILSRLLGPKTYGVLAMAMVVVSFAQLLSDGGLGKGLIQRDVIDESRIVTTFYTSISFGIVIFISLNLLSNVISDFFNEHLLNDVLKVLSVIFIIKSVVVVAEALVMRNMSFKPLAIRDFTSYLMAYIFIAIPLAYYGYGIWSLVFAVILQEAFKALFLLLMVPHSMDIRKIDLSYIKSIISFGGGLTLSSVFNKVATNADTLIVGKLLSTESLGVYSRGYKLMQLPASLFGTVVSSVLFPAFSKIKNNKQQIKNAHNNIGFLIAFFVMPASILLFFISEPLVHILLGNDWNQVIDVLKVLCFSLYFRVGYKLCGELIKSSGKVYSLSFAQVFYAILITVLSYLGQSKGIVGVAYGVSTALFFHFMIMSFMSSSCSGLTFINIVKFHIIPSAISIMLFMICFKVESYLVNLTYSDFTTICIFVSLYILVMISFSFFLKDRREMVFLYSLFHKVKR